MDKSKKKIYLKSILAVFLAVFFFSVCLKPVLAQYSVAPVSGGGYEIIGPDLATRVPPECIPDTFEMGSGVNSGLVKCIIENIKGANEDTIATLKALQKKQAREEMWDQIRDKARDVLALSFRNSLSSLSRQIAHDTAVWVASGGKGQKPLFITEGWGEYLKNAADSALGDFIDNIGQSYGVDLCEPDINIRIAIETGINWQKPREVSCTFSEMMGNWENAISNPNFSFEYTNSMRPGENDVSVFLTLQSRAFQTVAEKVHISENEAATDSLFKPVSNLVGKILTPGTVVKDAFLAAVNPAGDNASFGYETFTGTIADIIEEFLNTLVSQLLTNLQSGLFSSGGGDDNSGLPFQLPDLSSLFNPNASPRTYEGSTGAAERFKNLIPLSTRIGGPYDILTKLMLCTEQSKNNLGPTDCVLDPILAEAIRQKTQIKDLPNEVLDRVFAPAIDDVANPQIAFSERNIKIMRKYRIVPVGWEVAAERIRKAGNNKTYTLREVMKDQAFKEYFDPYWVLGAPELFCRQLGYGEHNSSANYQDGTITRDEYCADEQQCIQLNENGNCSAYGYCTEERRFWNFGGKTCQPRYNTCETFTGRDSNQDSWLTNSLDFSGCNENNYGCRWLSHSYNIIDNVWTHLEPEKVMTVCNNVNGCSLTIPSPSPAVKQGRIMTDDKKMIMSQPCSASACSNENLIKNGGGEKPLSSEDWSQLYEESNQTSNPIESKFLIATTTKAVGSIKPRGGEKMIAIRTIGSEGEIRMLKQLPTRLKAGKTYVLTAWVNTAVTQIGGIYMDFGISGDASTTIVCSGECSDNTNSYSTAVGGWQQLRRTITPINDFDFFLRFLIYFTPTTPSDNWVYLDDVQLQEVGTGRCVYSEEAKTCSFYEGTCTIPYGGVMCSVDNCEVGSNLLAGLNSGFETAAPSMDYRADKWNFENSYYNLENRLYREARLSGGYNLTMKGNNNPSKLSARLDNIQLTTGKRYALKFNLRADYVNQGGVAIGLYQKDNDTLINGRSFIYLPEFWQDYKFEFDATVAATNTYIKLTMPAQSQVLMYADDFELKEIDSSCNDNSVWLTNGLTSKTDQEVYFNAQMAACDGSAEGCSQFIRTKPGLGSNLIVNGTFNNATTGWEFLVNSFNYIYGDGKNYAKIKYNAATYGDFKLIDIMPGTYYMISFEAARVTSTEAEIANFEMFLAPNKTQTTTGMAVLSTDCEQTGDNTLTLRNSPAGSTFEKKYCKFLAPAGANYLRYKVFAGSGVGDEIYVDNIQLEPVYYNVDSPSAYTDYNPNTRPANQVAYLEKAPDFFNCYRSSTNAWATKSTLNIVLANRQPACDNYAPVCTRDEVGCELYTPTNGDPVVPGIVDALDVCPAQCEDYSVYRQEETNFVASKYRQFIADDNLKYCSAAYAGCDEFTNLDKLGEGAEAREYYVSFRVCQKPGASDEGTYYTWEGSDVSGYQLKVYRLKKSQLNSGDAPCTYVYYSTAGIASCSDNTIAGDPKNAGFCTRDQMFINPDCREFYNARNGQVSYRLLSKTISISDDCHPYRRTQTQIESGEAQTDCVAKQGYWKDNACVYMAIPSEGRTCPSSVMGCREFTGNSANNVRHVINSNFGTDSVSTSSWQDINGNTSGLKISTESSFVGGYSISNVGTNLVIKHPVSTSKGKAYILSFWAKSATTSGFTMGTIKFSSAISGLSNTFSLTSSTDGDLANANPIITTNWKKYDLGPVFVTWDPGLDEYLVFNVPSGKRIYLDNVILKEVRGDIFAIDNSWYTPLACDNKLGDETGQKAIDSGACVSAFSSAQGTRCYPGEMIGCAAYKDRAGTVNYFRSFTKLCRQDAAGCEALIDTYNYAPAESKIFNDGDNSKVTVKKDELVYLVNDRKYACRDSEKGCTAYGLPLVSKFDEVAGYDTVYLLNNPDLYDRTMCKFNEVWCDQYIGSASVRYFKNPHGKVCQYEVKTGSLEGNWYVQGTDELCITTADQTLGKGYGNISDKYQPIGAVDNVTGNSNASYSGWVGACPASQNTCSEIIDPLPYIYTPLRLEAGVSTTIKINTLYTLVGGNVLSFDPRSGKSAIKYPDQSSGNSIKRFYISCPKTFTTACQNENIWVTVDSADALLARAGVYYVFSNALDRGSCNGLVDYDSGCILVNNRASMDYASDISWTERVTKYLSYDSYSTYLRNRSIDSSGNAGQIKATAPLSGQNDSNLIIKVRPDRTCNSWLTCTTYEKKDDSSGALFSNNDKCLSVGLCDSLNDQGICDHFVSNAENSDYDPKRDVNKSGYVYLGSDNNDGYYSYELMTQQGESANISNGNFEAAFGSDSVRGIRRTGEITTEAVYYQPLGWSIAYYNCIKSGTNPCFTGYPRLVTEKTDGKEIHLNFVPGVAREGQGSLQINSGNAAISEFVELDANTDYIFSAWVNTANLIGTQDQVNGFTSGARAEIQLRFYDNRGNITTTGITTGEAINYSSLYDNLNQSVGYGLATEGGWCHDGSTNSKLRMPNGLNWRQMVFRFRTASFTNRMSIALMNMNPGSATVGYNNPSPTGYTLWDDIQLKPMLKANNSEIINRTCRIYPDQTASSCRYVSGNNSYYGLYGYCLLKDPANPEQCLQWWPVDNIKGEILDDFSTYYQERAPLYYCISKTRRNYSFFGGSIGTVASGKLPEEYQGVIKTTEGIQVTPFTVGASARPLFRYPFIYRFDPTLIAVGVGLDKGVYPLVFSAQMYPKRTCATIPILGIPLFCYNDIKEKAEDIEALGEDDLEDGGMEEGEDECSNDTDRLGGFIRNAACEIGNFFKDVAGWVAGKIARTVVVLVNLIKDIASGVIDKFVLNEDDFWGGIGIIVIGRNKLAIPIPLPWHDVYSFSQGGGSLFSALNEKFDIGIGGGMAGIKIITDNYGRDAGSLTDPVPSVPGDILGYATFVNAGEVYGAGTIVTFANNFRVEYCNKVVQVVNSSGQNKAWASRLTTNSSYESAQSDCVSDSLVEFGDPKQCFYVSDYCLQQTCRLNPKKICDFCENLVGEISSGKILTVEKKPEDQIDVTDVACPEHTGEITWGYRERLTNSGKQIVKVLRGGKECKDIFFTLYSDPAGVGFVYRRIYSNNKFEYDTDYRPFGSLVAPGNDQYPTQWDSRPEVLGNQPLYYELPNTGLNQPYQARMGQWHTTASLQQLFAQTYGVWEYDWESKRYVELPNEGWGLPTQCPSNSRPTAVSQSFCRVLPVIDGFAVKRLNNPVSAQDPLIVKLSFNIKVNQEQVPIRLYSVDWGDGTEPTSYSGVSLLPRPVAEATASSSVFTLYHYYDRAGLGDTVDIKVKAKDNWNAINGARFTLNLNSLDKTGECNCISTVTNYCGTGFCSPMLSGSGLVTIDGSEPLPNALDSRPIYYGDTINIYMKDTGGNNRWVYYGHRSEGDDANNYNDCFVRVTDAAGNYLLTQGAPDTWKYFTICNGSFNCDPSDITVKTGDTISLKTNDAFGDNNELRWIGVQRRDDVSHVDEWDHYEGGNNKRRKFDIVDLDNIASGDKLEIFTGDRLNLINNLSRNSGDYWKVPFNETYSQIHGAKREDADIFYITKP